VGQAVSREVKGFTLLEVLVVVGLIALTSAILVPALLRVDTSVPVSAIDELATTLSELSERSLFMGQITALRVTDHGYEPLYYNVDDARFETFETSSLLAQSLPSNLKLEWQADGDSDLSSQISKALEPPSDQDSISSQESQAQVATQDQDTNQPPPQVYFLPGGQASAGEFTLTTTDGKTTRVRLDTLGQVTKPSADDKTSTQLPPLLLPDDGSFYQQLGAGR
jgi:general secretion pathway protein H